MKRYIKELIVVSIVIVFVIAYNLKDNDEKIIISYDSNCEIFKAHDTIDFRVDPFSHVAKDVIFLKQEVVSQLRKWIPYINKYQNYPFVFYIETTDRKLLKENLKDMNFPIPVFLNKMQGENMLLISYRLNKDNELLKVTNPTLSNFKENLDDY